MGAEARKGIAEAETLPLVGREDAASWPGREILVAEDLRKSYGNRPALRGLSFSLKAGRIMGFLGPNGAGKTTAIRILTTILEPDSGRFWVDAIAFDQPEKIRRRIGVLPENLGFPKPMTGSEYLTFFGQLYGRAAAGAKAHGLQLLEEVGLKHRARSPIGTYSHGMRQRLGIARALVNDPVVVFLDEPTLGLDPRGQEELLALVQRIARERSAGVILCSHLLKEVESVCDDVVILSAGEVVARGSVAEVIGRGRRNIVLHSVVRIQVPAGSLGEASRVLERIPGVTAAAPTGAGATGGWVRAELVEASDGGPSEARHVSKSILGALMAAEIPVLTFETERTRLAVSVMRIHVPSAAVEEARRVLQAVPSVRTVTPTGEAAGGLRVEVAEPADGTSLERAHVNNRILEALIRAGIPVLSFETEGGRLHDAFLRLTAETIK